MTRQKQLFHAIGLLLFLIVVSGCGSKEKGEDAEYFHQTGITLFQEGFYDLLPKGETSEAHARLEQAEQAFRRAVELKPDLVESHRYLARVSALLKKYPEAADEYIRTIELEPENLDNYLFLSSLYVRMNRYEDAGKVLAHAKSMAKEPARLDQIDRLIKEIRAKAESFR